jgi:hypothetical protein
MKRTCGNCAHYVGGMKRNDPDAGECWRFPPTAFPKRVGVGQYYPGGSMRPEVRSDDRHCGEWKMS